MNMELVNDGKSKVKYKVFLTVFYGLICFVSLKEIIAFSIGRLASSTNYIPVSKWTIYMWINPVIESIIIILSIVIIILVIKKKLPKFNLIFPIYYLSFILLYDFIVPRIIWVFTHSLEEFAHWISIDDKSIIIYLIINFTFSSWFLFKLWVIKGKKA